MSDQTLKLAQRLIPHLGLLQHVMDLKTLATLSPLMKPPVRAALISPTSVMLVGPELISAPMDSTQIAVCYRLVAQFKGHEGQEYAITNGELRASLNREHSRLLTDPATLDLHSTLQGIAAILGTEQGEITSQMPGASAPETSVPGHAAQDGALRETEHDAEPGPATPSLDTSSLTGEAGAAAGPESSGNETGTEEPGVTDTAAVDLNAEQTGEPHAMSAEDGAAETELDEQTRNGGVTEDQNGARGDEPARGRRRRP